MNVTAPRDLPVAICHQCLSVKKRRLPPIACRSLVTQTLAVEAGIKPALLYDSNGASSEQIQDYLQRLQDAGLLSQDLYVLDIDESILIVNLECIVRHLEDILHHSQVALVDISCSLAQPAIASLEVITSVHGQLAVLLESFKLLKSIPSREQKLFSIVNLRDTLGLDWNLCSVFGFLLGYPTVYWFNQEKSFENNLTMAPLRVISLSVSCPFIAGNVDIPIYSFSFPDALWPAMKEKVEAWVQNRRDIISQRPSFTSMNISTETVCLPAVTL
ncbi:UPF0739 protein C1orf74 homolog [Polypterus senegalus]